MLTGSRIRKLLTEYYPLLAILIGIVLISVSIGPFENWDTGLEYEAASSVISRGIPYVNVFGNIINQPPLGFYVEALFLTFFGSSIDTGVVLITLFGLGCILTVYKIGDVLYDKPTGLAAAALFGLSPWALILSRTFLIDEQCLFFSLLCLLTGIYAIRKDSFKLSLVSGVLFAAAFLTKLYAVFTLIPLTLLFIYHRPKNLRRALSKIGAFLFPALLSAFLWYQIISGQGLLSVFSHSDFGAYNPSEVVPSYFFVGNFFLNYGLGLFFTIAVIFSLVVCFLRRRLFSKILVFDLICLATILAMVITNTYLGAYLNLKAPYNIAIKYDYQSLPFFSLIAASLVGKSLSLFQSAKSRRKLQKILLFSVVFAGLFLLVTTILVNMLYANLLSTSDYLLFRMEQSIDVGYSLFNPTPINAHSPLMILQYLGFAVVFSGLVWASRHTFVGLFRRLRGEIEPKDAHNHGKPPLVDNPPVPKNSP
jgi:4-amino-4-deoxy-L-arabinose transferase-like glycosyltransferase